MTKKTFRLSEQGQHELSILQEHYQNSTENATIETVLSKHFTLIEEVKNLRSLLDSRRIETNKSREELRILKEALMTIQTFTIVR